MIRIGPAGIPLSCKGRTLKDGIIYTSSLELDSLEVQFVRGIRMTEEDAAEVGEVALEAGVELHVHAPYYTNLAGDERNVQLTRDKVLKAANLAHIMGAKTVVVHPGFYGECTPEEAMERVVRVATELRDEFKANNWSPQLGLVTMGKRAVFGTIEEIVEVCRRVDGIRPIIDFSHIHARGNGSLNTVEDFQDVFDQLIPLGLNHYLIHFTGVAYDNGNERHHLPIKKGDLRFEPLVEVILENDYNVTLISTSPILEHDAMYMQIVLDRVKEKREQRLQKEAQKAREDEEAALRGDPPADAEPEPAAKPEPKPKPEPRPPCAALTQAGTECSNLARQGSKYCSSHKGYRPNKAAAEPKKAAKAKAEPKSDAEPKKAAKAKAEPKSDAEPKKATKAKAEPKSDAEPKKATKKSSKAAPKTDAESKKATKKPASGKATKKAPKSGASGSGSNQGNGPAKTATKKATKAAKKTVTKTAKKAATKTAPKKAATKTAPKKAAKKAATKKAAKSPKKANDSSTGGADTPATKSKSSPKASDTKKGVGGRLKQAAQRLVNRK